MEKPNAGHWWRTLRPLLGWVLIVLVLLGIHTHQRLMEKTRLDFTLTMQGQPLYGAATILDGQPAIAGQRISLGSHIFVVTHPKGEMYSTNLSIWYGEHNLGTIDLKRTMGTLSVTVDPPADWLIIRGPEWSVTLTNSPGLTQSLPTDSYEIEAQYPHWQKKYQATVFSGQTTPFNIAPHFGGLQLGCNQSDATFRLQASDGQIVAEGVLPATISGLPAGDYQLNAAHHGRERTKMLTVKASTTNDAQMDFQYGMAMIQTSPAGVRVMSDNGQNYGETPLTLLEMQPGNFSFTLQRAGYQSVALSFTVRVNETNFISTNLVSETYLHAVNETRQYMAAADYDHALQSAANALAAKADDAEALSLQREVTGRGILQQAKKLGQQGDYLGGGKELARALQWLPDNGEAKQLLIDFKQHEPEQIERLRAERYERPKTIFGNIMLSRINTSLFESHELKTSKPAKETLAAIAAELKSGQPSFQVAQSDLASEVFMLDGTQEFAGGSRECVIVIGQSKVDGTRIFFNVIEFKKVAFYDQPLGALVGAMPVKYTVIDPSQPGLNDKLKAQVQAGVSDLTARIQVAMGQSPSQPVVPAIATP